ncbi:low temperature requirement protein A [Curtobacterium sp. MCPF17_047]|uniref:low temperature requirement protein A n=1 Tax=unclassified Curtobacterium TaxID=257496 RepID=UPI000DAA3BE5|nr:MULTISPECIES: low temperature requirement protein A [unclassified Curtobacterium]PZE60469.1 low temperature requirement protein A [Curtobacterium sp. MCPF17_001]PZF67700.1 low temperature requirement protein A [Curtobacterium sp. MCPF17_047]
MRTIGLRRMGPRDPAQRHRTATPLELLFDLVFVVAVGLAATNLHEIEAEGRLTSAVLSYGLVFFSIWWAWMNFTWFATSFDTDDWLYRVTTVVQMAGVLVLAAGVHAAMVEDDFTIGIIGYVLMRLALVGQWIRAAVSSTRYRRTAVRYAVGIVVVQVLWIVSLALPEGLWPFAAPFLVLGEVLVPVWAELGAADTRWHTRHLAERYSLFTLIVLGEGLVASANAVIDALAHTDHLGSLLTLAACGLVITVGMWWIYFSREQHDHIHSLPTALLFGYGHYLVFAAAGALPAGIEVAVLADAGHVELSSSAVAATVAVPVAVFVLSIWALAIRPSATRRANVVVVVLTVAVLASVAVPAVSLPVTALLVAAVVVTLELPSATPHEHGSDASQARGSRLSA